MIPEYAASSPGYDDLSPFQQAMRNLQWIGLFTNAPDFEAPTYCFLFGHRNPPGKTGGPYGAFYYVQPCLRCGRRSDAMGLLEWPWWTIRWWSRSIYRESEWRCRRMKLWLKNRLGISDPDPFQERKRRRGRL